MKLIDNLWKKIILAACISAAIITCISVLSGVFRSVSTLDEYREAIRHDLGIEDLMNQVAFKVYAENEMSKTGRTAYTDVFFDNNKVNLGMVELATIERDIRNMYIENLDDIYNLSAVFIDHDTNKKTYFNKGSVIPVKLYKDEFDNYSLWYKIEFDKDGNQTVTSVDPTISLNINPLVEIARHIKDSYIDQISVTSSSSTVESELVEITESATTQGFRPPEMKNCTLIFAIGTNFTTYYDDVSSYIISNNDYYSTRGIEDSYLILGFLAGGLGLLLSAKKIRASTFGPVLDSQCWELRGILMYIVLRFLIVPYEYLSRATIEFRGIAGGDFDVVAGLMYAFMTFVSILVAYFGIFICAYWTKTLFTDGLKESLNKVKTKAFVLSAVKTMKAWLYSLIQIKLSSESTMKFIGVMIANIVCMVILIAMFDTLMAATLYTVITAVIATKFMKSMRNDYQKLQAHTKRLADGDLNTEIISNLGIFEPLVEELENIRIGFKVAIDEETKSQVMKTELISNVSHDLKTPLTSLISYVDLMKKEKNSKKKDEYLETVERSSMRLKHLIDDLFEVSKANSGDIKLEIVDVDLVSLVNQTLFECKPQIEKSNLTFKTEYSKEKIILPLDAHKTYRIIENVIGNAIKYSVANTRVYIEVIEEDLDVVFSIRNVSSEEITFDPNDLVERFVRGDKSRNSDGSGLGLAIAKGFTEAQKGKLKIETDGDYFKVIIQLRKSV